MTILDASNKLLEWFVKNDTFCLTSIPNGKDDFNKIVLITERPDVDRAAFLAALDEIEKIGVIKKKSVDYNNYWILVKPLDSYEQTVTISGTTASIVAQIINQFCDVFKDDVDRCDAGRICEKDVKNLTNIINYLVNNAGSNKS